MSDYEPGPSSVAQIEAIGDLRWLLPRPGKTAANQSLLPYFQVNDYGAVADGATDATAAIQATINAAAAVGGGTVNFGPGNYNLISGGLVVNHDSIHLIGSGIGVTTITTNHATADVFTVGDGVTLRSWVTVADMVIRAAVGKTAGAFVNANLVADLNLRRMRFDGAFNGVKLFATQMTRLEDLHIINCTPATGTCVIADGNGTNLYLTRVATDAPVGAQPLTGLSLRQWDGVFLTDTQFNHVGIGLQFEPAAGLTFQHLFAVDCSFDSNSVQGMRVLGAVGTVRRCWFVGCWFGSNTTHGVTLNSNAQGFTFINPKFVANGNHGIQVQGCVDTSIISPMASGNSSSSAGTFDAIIITGGTSRVKIIGGDCRPLASFANTQQRGITIGAGAGDFITIDNVNCDGNADPNGISNGATGNHVAIRNSYPYNPRGSSVTQPAVPATATDMVNATGLDCQVCIIGGNVTQILISGVATGLVPPASIRVPAGQVIRLVYTVAPTWTWFGD